MHLRHISKAEIGNPVLLALYSSRISAGFPSPAEEYIENALDLNELLISKPAATYLLKVEGDSMSGIGIYDGSILVVDKSIEANPGDVVVATVGGEFLVKTLIRSKSGKYRLRPEAEGYATIDIDEDSTIWGVVTWVLKKSNVRAY